MTAFKYPEERDLPPGWKRHPEWRWAQYTNTKRNLMVLIDVSKKSDGKQWIHVSYSHPNRIPDHDTTVYIRRHFLGENRECIAVFPPKDRYVSIHPNCLHLWSPVDSTDITWPRFEEGSEAEFGFKSI